MGLKEALGLQRKATIGIVLDRYQYLSGEVVTGRAQLEVFEPVACRSITMTARGFEKTYWEEKRTRQVSSRDANGKSTTKTETYTVSFSGHHTFFEVVIPLRCVPGSEIAPGTYLFPFEYTLPGDTPSSCSFAPFASASINYQMEGKVDVSGGIFARELKADVPFGVKSNVAYAQEVSSAETFKNVKFCCCFSKGNVHLKGQLERSVYFPGEVANIITHIANDSTVDMTKISCKLYMQMKLRDNSSNTHNTGLKCSRQTFQGVKSQEKGDQILAIRLPNGKMQPTHVSKLIECHYGLKISCGMGWCSNVKLDLPIVIAEECIVNIPTGIPVEEAIVVAVDKDNCSK